MMGNKFWAADGAHDRQAAFAIGTPGNAAGAGDEAGAAAEVAGDQSSKVLPSFPASLAPGQKVGNSRYESFRPQVPMADEIGRSGERAAPLASDGDDLASFGTARVDNINQACG